jgi:hypothetical protein
MKEVIIMIFSILILFFNKIFFYNKKMFKRMINVQKILVIIKNV